MKAQVIQAPDRPKSITKPTIFLAGTTTPTPEGDWRETLINKFSHYPVTFLNPARKDWDSTWKEDLSDARWAEQIEWELQMQEEADIVVIFFHEVTLAPISLLELGVSVRSGKVIACAMPGYAKRGNVQAVCAMYQGKYVASEEELRSAVEETLKVRHGVGEVRGD